MAPKTVLHPCVEHRYSDSVLVIATDHGSAQLARCEQRGAGEQE